jgi:hypothetical protein
MAFTIAKETTPKAKSYNKYDTSDSTIQQVTEKSDIAEVIKELNSDIVDKDNFSGIDMKANLHPLELSGILCLDVLVSIDFFAGDEVGIITRKKLRLSPSKSGTGREQIVSISQGLRDQNSSRSFGERFSSLFTGGSK